MSTKPKKMAPIFIHSLFRAGSTYIFNLFRRSEKGYWCYQESLNEFVFASRNNPELLNTDHGEEKIRLLRHPDIGKSYFQELFDVWPAWQDKIKEPALYQAYFSDQSLDNGIEYLHSLIDAAKGRPVFQECRTSGRIDTIKRSLNGFHIYLWRNPWDQWWSYKVHSYFDWANQLIINANNPPAPLRNLLNALQLSHYEYGDIPGAFAFYESRPLTSEQSYLVFYMLWCLGLREGSAHADLLLNIDRLSDSEAYQDETLSKLKASGIDGISFADCHIPQGAYTENEKAFFEAAEAQVNLWLIEGGWDQREIAAIQTLRKQYEPLSWEMSITEQSPLQLIEHLDRFKALSRRYETSFAESVVRASQAEAKVLEAQELARAAESRTIVAEEQAQAAKAREEQKAIELSREIEFIRGELHNVNKANHHHWQLAEQRQRLLEAVLASKSWRLTQPLRDARVFVLSIVSRPLRFAVRVCKTFVSRRPALKRAVRWTMRRFPFLARLASRLEPSLNTKAMGKAEIQCFEHLRSVRIMHAISQLPANSDSSVVFLEVSDVIQ